MDKTRVAALVLLLPTLAVHSSLPGSGPALLVDGGGARVVSVPPAAIARVIKEGR